jgi:bla regulator protein blaR1
MEKEGPLMNWGKKQYFVAVVLIAVTVPVVPGLAQETSPDWQKAAGGKMEFEVASIRVAEPGSFRPPSFALNIDDTSIPPGGRFLADFLLETYIQFAYKIMPTREQKDSMIADLPLWVKSDHFVIQAEAAGNPSKDQMRLMMQSLLASRFKLKMHFETRTESVLALVVVKRGKPGPRLRLHAEGLPCDAKWTPPPDLLSPSVPPGGFLPSCGWVGLRPAPNGTFLAGSRNITMEQIAQYMPSWQNIGRPVVDRTGLSGRYDFSLYSMPERNDPLASSTDAQLNTGAPTFLEALKEQLGLELRSTKAPIQVLVIDHVERPSAN